MADINTTIPADGVRSDKSDVRANWVAINNRIGTLPDDYSEITEGSVITVNAEQTGIGPADGPVDFRGQRVRSFMFTEVENTGSENLDQQNHCGRIVKCTGTTNRSLHLTFDSAEVSYVEVGFTCRVWRVGTGEVTITFGQGLVNGNPSGHTNVQQGRMVEIYVSSDGTVYLDGATEAA